VPHYQHVRVFLEDTVKLIHTAPWLHYLNKNVFSDRRNQLYNKSASLRCDGKLFHSPGPAAAKAVTKGAVGLNDDACPMQVPS